MKHGSVYDPGPAVRFQNTCGTWIAGGVQTMNYAEVLVLLFEPYRLLFDRHRMRSYENNVMLFYGPFNEKRCIEMIQELHWAGNYLIEALPRAVAELQQDERARTRFLFRMETALPLGRPLDDDAWYTNVLQLEKTFGIGTSVHPWTPGTVRGLVRHQADLLLYRTLLQGPVDIRVNEPYQTDRP